MHFCKFSFKEHYYTYQTLNQTHTQTYSVSRNQFLLPKACSLIPYIDLRRGFPPMEVCQWAFLNHSCISAIHAYFIFFAYHKEYSTMWVSMPRMALIKPPTLFGSLAKICDASYDNSVFEDLSNLYLLKSDCK